MGGWEGGRMGGWKGGRKEVIEVIIVKLMHFIPGCVNLLLHGDSGKL